MEIPCYGNREHLIVCRESLGPQRCGPIARGGSRQIQSLRNPNEYVCQLYNPPQADTKGKGPERLGQCFVIIGNPTYFITEQVPSQVLP